MRTLSLYHRHRFPAEIISHCVWLYFRFPLSSRDVEEMLAMRGVKLSYETIREWALKFGQTYTNGLRRRSPRPGDRWHLDEVFHKINGQLHYLWRAVDQDGHVLDIMVQNKRDKKAAKKFFRKLLERLRNLPRVIVTDKLRSYSAARTEATSCSLERCGGWRSGCRLKNRIRWFKYTRRFSPALNRMAGIRIEQFLCNPPRR